MKLTDIEIKAAFYGDALTANGTPRKKLADGEGLYLLLAPSGSKLWRFKYRYSGVEKLLAFGSYPKVSMKDARAKKRKAMDALEAGEDPMAAIKSKKAAKKLSADNSFASVAAKWLEHWRIGKNPRHAEYVARRMELDVLPEIGVKPIESVEVPELVAMVKKISDRGAIDIAKRCLQLTGQVFRYAIAHGLGKRNPATDVKPSDVLPSRKKENYARIDAKELPELLRHIEGYQGTTTTRLAMKLMAMTFVRTSELIGARWAEFDLEAQRWDIPAERMKMKTPHIVPLSKQAIEVLRVLQIVTGHSALLFPGERDHDKPMSNNTILAALKRMGYRGRMTGHGFRGIASTVLHELGFNHAHIELQLAHQERDQVSAAYNHATYLKDRASMMQRWSDYLDAATASNVLDFEGARAAHRR